jgi:hypothetical protein
MWLIINKTTLGGKKLSNRDMLLFPSPEFGLGIYIYIYDIFQFYKCIYAILASFKRYI